MGAFTLSNKFTFVCWKWRPKSGYRSQFNHNHVNTLYNMLKRNYQKPFELVCVTENDYMIDKNIRIVPLWDDYKDLQSPQGIMNPSCYRRLKMFSEDAKELIGPRFLSMDLDVVITRDLTPIVNRKEDFVAFGDTHPTTFYNGSLILHTAGTRKQLWEEFDPIESPRKAKAAGHFGSDQAWISYCLGPNEAKFSPKDGCYSWRCNLAGLRGRLPDDARIILFHGMQDPWGTSCQKFQWIVENYR